MSAGLSVQDVAAGYGKVHVLRGVTLSLGTRETLALLGPNGSGKSTLARTVMGLTSLYEGTLTWDGVDITTMPTWRRVERGLGYVPQTENIFPKLTVGENLSVGGVGTSRAAVHESHARLLEVFPILRRRLSLPAGSLSGGERRMLAFATALVREPKLLILDEPTSDLAPSTIDVLFDKIRQVRDELALPLLLVEQNVSRALELADRVCILLRGEVVVDRPSSEITEEEIGAIFLEHVTPLSRDGDPRTG